MHRRAIATPKTRWAKRALVLLWEGVGQFARAETLVLGALLQRL
jgi:hypothetical protein